jgi:hypothetical protein
MHLGWLASAAHRRADARRDPSPAFETVEQVAAILAGRVPAGALNADAPRLRLHALA